MPTPLPGSDVYIGKGLPGENVGIDDTTPRVAASSWSDTETLLIREMLAWWTDRAEQGAAPLITPIAAHLSLPGLRAYWPGSSVGPTYTLHDISGQDRHLTAGAGHPYVYVTNRTGTIQLSRHDGEYYTRPHESALSFTTTGFAMFAWIRLSGAAQPSTFFAKMGASGAYSYALRLHAQTASASTWRFLHSSDGATLTYNEATVANPAGWHHAGITFTPSGANKCTLWLDGAQYTTVTGTEPSTFYANTEPFTIGYSAYDTTTLDCTFAHAFVAAFDFNLQRAFLSDLYQATRTLFGV